MKERLLHILDGTACLTRRQMKDYLAGTMLPEEIHAAEAHIASCPLCNMALEGFEANSDEALAAIGSLNSSFLKEHFDAITPQIHLNSLAPAATLHKSKKKHKSISLLRLVSVAAIALLAVGVFWYLKYGQDNNKSSGMIAQRDDTHVPVPASTPPAPVRIADSIMPQPTTASRSNTAALDEPAPIIKEKKEPVAAAEPAKDFVAKNNNADTIVAANEKYAAQATMSMSAPAAAPIVVSKKANKFQLDEQPVSLAKAAEDKARKERRETEEVRGEMAMNGNRSSRTLYNADAPTMDKATDHLRKGDEYFGAGKYGAALKSYRAEMSSGDRARSSQASVMAARCYINLGQKQKGIELLQRIVNDGSGSQRRQAKRLLRDLQRE